MSLSEEILKSALLGTEKYLPQISGDLKEIADQIVAEDNEDGFLKMASVVFCYEESGSAPIDLEAEMIRCPDESKKIISPKITDQFKTIIQAKDENLFRFLVWKCNQNEVVLSADLIPEVLNKALEHKKSAGPLLEICGETGQWLCSMNENWKSFYSAPETDESWETGSLETRKEFITVLRQTKPEEARALIQTAMPQENANNRAALIAILKINTSLEDEPFLVSLLQDKSQKVKEQAQEILRSLPGSALNNLFLKSALSIMSLKEERYLLISKKKLIDIRKNAEISPEVFAAGIEKVSVDKGVDDTLFALAQMLSFIDPALLAKRLQTTPEELIRLFLQHKDSKVLIPWLVQAATRFNDKTWARQLLDQDEVRDINLLNILEPLERTIFYEKFIGNEIGKLMDFLFDDNYTPVPVKTAEKIMDFLEKNPYAISQVVYQRLALQLPTGIMSKLSKIAETSPEDYQLRFFKNQAIEMNRIINFRENIKF